MKQRVTLLCNYSRVKDPAYETMEMLEASKVARWVARLVFVGTIILVRNMVDAFLVNF